MPVFPLPFYPTQPYDQPPLSFGSSRGGGKQAHAACDLAAPAGTAVLSVADGVVVQALSGIFYADPASGGKPVANTYDMIVRYPWGLVRYGEIDIKTPQGIVKGTAVTEGQQIASVAAQNTGTELHFELYGNPEDLSPLTVMGNMNYLYVPSANYHRRKDLQDPAWFLYGCLLANSSLYNYMQTL